MSPTRRAFLWARARDQRYGGRSSPSSGHVRSAMKKSNPLNNDDLDAGWDVSDEVDTNRDPAASGSISVPPQASQRTVAAHTDELDDGWDAEPDSASPQATPFAAAVPAPAVGPAQHKLTKKERRELERKQRAHAAKKQAELKQNRKQQRQATVAQAKTPRQPALVADPRARDRAPATKKRRKAKPQRVAPPNQGPPSRTVTRVASAGARHQAERPAAVEVATTPAQQPRARQRYMALVVVVVVVVALVVLQFLQKK